MASCGVLILFVSLTPRHTSDLGPVYTWLILCHKTSCLQSHKISHLGCCGSQNVPGYPAVFDWLDDLFSWEGKGETG